LLVTLAAVAAACGSSTASGPATSGPATSGKGGSTSPSTDEGLTLRFGTVRQRTIDPKADGSQLPTMVTGMNQFAIDLFRRASKEESGNLVLGPYSVTTALGLIYAGAAGQTATEMAAVLHTGMPADKWHKTLNAYDLTLDARTAGSPTQWQAANKVWVQNGLDLLPTYLDRVTGDYGAPVAEADFAGKSEASRQQINGWVERSTNSLIPELFPKDSIDGATVVALVNAVALDAPWEFPLYSAGLGTFTRPDGTTVQVSMMGYNEFLPTAYSPDYQAVELPYAGGALSMVVIMPNDLAAFEAELDAASLSALFGTIKDGGIHLSMPKWSARTHLNLNNALTDLGMPSAFGAADFSAMTGAPGLFLSTVEHEAFIEVDEKGTRAAAATGGAMAASHGPTININKPFLYVIRDKGSGAVLFIGRVTDPSQPA
jgi:serpin B